MKVPFENLGNPNDRYSALIDPMKLIRADICPYCNSQRIELFSFNGYPQQYRYAVDEFIKGNLISYDKYEIRVMKCRSCNKEFIIDWYNGMPFPLIYRERLDQFISEFKNGF